MANKNFVVKNGLQLGADTQPTLSGDGSQLKIQTTGGYVSIGPDNSTWMHFSTDRSSFYFNKHVSVDGNLQPYNTSGLRDLGATGYLWNHVYANGYFIGSNEVIDASRNLTNIGSITASGSHTFTSNDVDFIVQDTTDSITNFIWRDHSANKLYLGTPNAEVNIRSAVQIGDTVGSNLYGFLQVNQEANNDESGIGILDSTGGRSMRLWVDATTSYISSGNAGGGDLVFNEAITVSSVGNLTGVGTISSGNITTTGYLRGPSTFTIDPATHGDDTGLVVIAGDLQVDGTTTTVNSTTVAVSDLNFTVAKDAANAAAANTAGLTVAGADAQLKYIATGDKWTMNKPLDVTGNLLLDVDNAEINLKSGVGSTSGAVNWTFNTAGTDYASIKLPYATRASIGLHIDSGYPLTLDGTTSVLFAISGNNKATINNSGLTVVNTITASGGNSGQWNTAYTYSQVGHLPLAGGTMTGNLTVSIPDNGGAPATTSVLALKGYEGRGAGIEIRDQANSAASSSNREWFIGSGYNQSGFNIGYSATGSQSSYPAQNKLSIDTSGNAVFSGTVTATGLTVNKASEALANQPSIISTFDSSGTDGLALISIEHLTNSSASALGAGLRFQVGDGSTGTADKQSYIFQRGGGQLPLVYIADKSHEFYVDHHDNNIDGTSYADYGTLALTLTEVGNVVATGTVTATGVNVSTGELDLAGLRALSKNSNWLYLNGSNEFTSGVYVGSSMQINGTTRFNGSINFSGANSFTGSDVANWNTAYGWGNHASGGYLAASHDMTLTLSGDASGAATFTNMGNATLAVTVANDSHTHSIYLPKAGGTMTGKLTLNDTGYSLGNEYHKWKRAYTVTTSSPQEILYSDGNSLPTGGVYRFTAHIDGTGTDQFATAVYWNQNGTWRINVTGQSGTSSNHPEFIIDATTNKPTIHIDHSTTYSIQILAERIELTEGTGTDNAGYAFGTDAFLGSVNNNLYFLPGGTAATGPNSYDDGNVVWHTGDLTTTNKSNYDTAVTVANAALPKAGGAMTGPITTNSTFDGVDIATRDAVLTSTTTTANAALPKAGGTMTGDLIGRDIRPASGYHYQRSNHHSGHLEGSYNNVGADGPKSNPIYTIGSSYNPLDAGLSNMYGIGYCSTAHTGINFTGQSNWGMYVAADGDARVWLDGTAGVVTSTGEHYVGSSRVFHDTYHPNADKWTTARTLTLSGDVTGSVSFDGSAAINMTNTVVANNSHTHNNLSNYYLDSNPDGYTSNVGDITGVTAGTGLTGGGTSGAVTLNVIGGTGITANADNITVDSTVLTTSTYGTTLTPVYAPVKKGTATLTNAYQTVCTVNGNSLASTVRMTISGTGNSTVIGTILDIVCNHHQDILVTSQTGTYTTLTVKIVSNNNEDFAVQLKTNSTNNLPVNMEVFALNSETVAFTSTNPYTGATLEHECKSGGFASSSSGGATHGFYSNGSVLATAASVAAVAALDPTLTLSGDVTGSATFTNLGNATLTTTVANNSHTHNNLTNYVLKAGDTLTGTLTTAGNIVVPSNTGLSTAGTETKFSTAHGYIQLGPMNTSWAHIYTDRPNFYFNKQLYVLSQKVFHDTYHPNADKWTTARTLTLSGDVTGSVSFDGSAAINMTNTVVANDSHTHSNYVLKAGDTMTGALNTPTLSLGTDATNTSAHRMSVYDSGATSYGMMLWNSNGTAGDWATMIYGPNQASRRISFGKINNATFADHGDVTEIAYFDLDDSTLRLDADAYVGSSRVFHDTYHPNADVWTTARNLAVTLTGAVTGTATQSVNGSADKTWTVATTATSDPTLTLAGDVTGSATFTNLGNATLTAVVANDSHYHSQVYIPDTRGAQRAPSYYPDRYVSYDFQNSNDTLAGDDAWHVLQTVAKWASYDASHSQQQIAYTGPQLKHREATSDTAWGGWKTLWDSNNLVIGDYVHKNANTMTGSAFKLGFHSGIGGTTFGANHYSMGVDVANGSWSGNNYSDLIIGYHTGIRIGAGYSGIRFYDNSPTTDTNNDGNGDGSEELLMTIGGGGSPTSGAHVIVHNNLTVNDNLYFGDGNDGYFYSDSNGRTAFAGGDFYIQSSVGNCYIYATNTYLGNTSGDNIRFRANTVIADSWGITSAGAATFAGVTSNVTGNVTGSSGSCTGNAATVTTNHSDGGGNYPIVWRSGGTVYYTDEVYITASTNRITATSFAGALSGNATTATTATNATNIYTTQTAGTAGVHYPTFVSVNSSGNKSLKFDPGMMYDPSTNTLGDVNFKLAGTLTGSLVGNASTVTTHHSDGGGNYPIVWRSGATTYYTDEVYITASTNTVHADNHICTAGTDHGIGFWGGLTYAIRMGDNQTNHGTVTDYSMHHSMDTTGGRGFTFGSSRTAVTCSINANTGAILSSNNITAYSDIRVKDNIEVIPNALDKVSQISGYTFTRTDVEDKEQKYTGVIAQEVLKVLPEAVQLGATEEDTMSVAYGNMVGLMIEAIKELKSEVDDLRTQLSQKGK